MRSSVHHEAIAEAAMFLGIEIGGTKLQLGLGEGTGNLAALWRGNVDPTAGAEGIRRQIMTALPIVLTNGQVNRARLQGVGIGFGGPVDDDTCTVVKSHQIEGWDDFPLADWIGETVQLPAVLGNDADVAGLAEARFGAGQGVSPVFYITIGSGIGGGLIIDGTVYRGFGRGAAEIGHVLVNTTDAAGRPQRCILEEVSSGWGLGKFAHARLANGYDRDSRLWTLSGQQASAVSGKLVGQAAADGDAFARAVLQRGIDGLAEAISQMLTLLAPRRIVIGGGVALLGEKLLFEPLRAAVAQRVFPPFAGRYDIVPAALGETVVVHGALALARMFASRGTANGRQKDKGR